MRGKSEDDDTIKIARRPPVPRSWRLVPVVGLAVLLAVGLGSWIWLRSGPPPGVPPVPTVAAVGSGQGQAVLDAPMADEATILAARGPGLLVFRFREAPAILVLSFPSLAEQGDMLDRVAAFVEKAGLPRDRVLDDADLDTAIRQTGDTRETYYYGHDYRAADIARFFSTADRDGVVLNAQEVRLRALVGQAGMLAGAAVGALISIPPLVPSQQIDASSRATILHHELSHGVYFTDPAYAAYARTFWLTVLTEAQRAGFRRFLGSEGYDTTDEDLMLNEAQAFLVHTEDSRYFLPDRAGLSADQAAQLRAAFVLGMPDGWLKAAATRGQ